MFLESEKIKRQRRYVRLTLQSELDTRNGEVLHWLLSNSCQAGDRDKVLDAVRAFWLPNSQQNADCYSPQELKETAQFAIWRLEEQIWYLRSHFNLHVSAGAPAMSSLFGVATPSRAVPPEVSPVLNALNSKGLGASGEGLQPLDLKRLDWSADENELGEAEEVRE